ncbi:MAG: hypothetical protein ACYSWS_06635 [Planctomycetota bacterium]|jgi:hypothetical protein
MAVEIGVDEIDLRPMCCDMSMELFWNDKEKLGSITEWLPRETKLSRYNYKTKKR